VDLVLVRVQSDGQSRAAKLRHSRTVVGRQTGCQLRIGSGEVSREHCEVVVEEGSAIVRDLGSRNGTYVNRVKVNEKRLEAGDLVSIGPVVFLTQIDGEPAEFDAAAMYKEGTPVSETASGGSPSDAPSSDGGLMDGIESASDESSVVEFDFDFEDEEEEQRSQPPL